MTTRPLHLARLDLLAFRGIEQSLELEFGRRLTIIYGGNATGKSSIAQAIEFALSGQVRDHEDGLIPAGYLANTRAGTPGRASITLDDGAVLTGATDRPRSDIERRFREIGTVDWPERQPLPITTTHVTTQGMLARVLGNANAVTRNDLSGLCAGAYLRFLVARAEKLADHFRQASSGRNVQSELRDARANYDTAKLLLDSLLVTSRAADISEDAIDLKLRDLNTKLNLLETTSIVAALSHLESQRESIEHQIRIIQGLLSRARELGQHEAESNQLEKQLTEAEASVNELGKSKAAATAALLKVAEKLKDLAGQRANLLDLVAIHERHQQSISVITAFDERLRELRANEQRIKDDIQGLKQELDSTRRDLVARSAKLAQFRQSRQVAEVQRNAIHQAIVGILALPTERDPEVEANLDTLTREIAEMEQASETASRELEDARREEALVASRLSEVSKLGERFLAASNHMRSFLADSHCPFCGHDHGSVEALEQSIEHMSATAVQGADLFRRQFEFASKRRQELESKVKEVAERIARTRNKTTAFIASIEKKAEDRRIAFENFYESLRRAGIALALETEALQRGHAEVEARIAGLDQEIRDATGSEREDETTLSSLERALAAKSSEFDQLDRVAAELNDQIGRIRSTLGASTTAEEIAKNKVNLLEIEPLVRSLEREQGQIQANLLELDRAIAERRSELAGIGRRLSVVAAFLESLDAELESIGATRDVRTVLDIEQRTRQQHEELIGLRGKALEIKQDQQVLDEGRAVLKAQQQLRDAEQALKAAQNRQHRLQIRSTQFKNLFESLEGQQNDTAEIVLENIRRPVSIVFQAMTAGCPWDIEFRLEGGKVNAILTDGSARDVAATSVLNSAYVNVAAIALRLALASQQRWTRLRTIVLDDPILEMDHLTQSALIDGLEAVLSSAFAPWENLQFVLTTWSEDFAVMAAHKLAHLNDSNGVEPIPRSGASVDDFIIHRLSSDLDGTIVSQRHVPRWRIKATSAA